MNTHQAFRTRIIISTVITILVLLGGIVGLTACGEKSISMPNDSESYTGKSYEEVLYELQTAGFSNVEKCAVEDLTSLSDMEDGAVESISINGDTTFSKNKKFPIDAEVIVTYHIIPKISVPVSSDEIASLSTKDIIKSFSSAGFENISTKVVYDLDPDEVTDKYTSEVKINGRSSFSKSENVPFDSSIEVICHYSYNKFTVGVTIDFIPNIIFDKYDVSFSVDNNRKGTLIHGEDGEFEFRIKEGEHTLSFTSKDNASVKGEMKIDVTSDVDVAYQISCHSDKIDVEEIYIDYRTTLANDESKILCTQYDFIGENYKTVDSSLKEMGFTNIITKPVYDIVWGITEEESVSAVTIAGKDDYRRGDVFKKDTEIIITYHMMEEDATSKNNTSGEPNAEIGEDDKQNTSVAEEKIERFVLSPNNDCSTMHSRDEREFSVIAYPKGITKNDFIINTNWEEYINISDIKLEDKEDTTIISFKVTIDPSLLSHSSTAMAMITLESTNDKVKSDDIYFSLVGVEIFDAEPLTLNPEEPQVATFKVIPASLPLEELQIGINNAVDNLDAKIIDSEIDEEHNCQYVHVKITTSGRYNGMSKGYVNLNDIYQYRGGTCNLTINE